MQGLISNVVSLIDADASQGGNQPGWEITIDGVNPILKGSGPCCQQAIKIKLLESQATAYPKAYPSWVDWPLQAGQTVEFHALCDATSCHLVIPPDGTSLGQIHYFRQTSP